MYEYIIVSLKTLVFVRYALSTNPSPPTHTDILLPVPSPLPTNAQTDWPVTTHGPVFYHYKTYYWRRRLPQIIVMSFGHNMWEVIKACACCYS